MMQETKTRFTRHEPCEHCGFKYGFHICLKRDQRTMQKEEPVKKPKPVVERKPMSDEQREQRRQSALNRWERDRASYADRDQKIAARYAEGTVSAEDLAREFSLGRERILQILRKASDAGVIVLRPPGKQKTNLEREERNKKIAELYKNGSSTRELCKEFEIASPQAIISIVRAAGVEVRRRGTTNVGVKAANFERDKEIARLYREEGANFDQLMEKFNLSRRRINTIIAAAGLVLTPEARAERDKKIIARYVNDEIGMDTIAKEFEMSTSGIREVLLRHGVARRQQGQTTRWEDPIEKAARAERDQKIIDLYLTGEPARVVGEVFNLSEGTVEDILKKNGVELRTRADYYRKDTA